jgi:outer membrane protein, adhesin transport system
MTFKSHKAWAVALPSALILSAAAVGSAQAVELKDAIEAAVASNPQINQAAQNREAIDFERAQAQGLYLPRVTVEASAGARRLENPTRTTLGLDDETLEPLELDLTIEQVLFDSGARRSELVRQAARSDGAALRVEERSEFIALEVVRYYLNYLLQERLLAVSEDNVAFHDNLVGALRQGVQGGSISVADQQQAEERAQAARARRAEARENRMEAAIAFMTLTGMGIDTVRMPSPVTAALPRSLDDAIALARTDHPRVQAEMADLDAAHALIGAAKADLGPRISLEGRGRWGQDIDGFEGDTTDLLARVVLRWTIFDGYINSNKVQEHVRRASEQRYRVHEVQRNAEQDLRSAWNRRESQGQVLTELQRQGQVSDQLIGSYREQFNVGRRSLLDLLDAQNTRSNVQGQVETARFAQLFAEYKILAATNQLLKTLNVALPKDADASSRTRFKVPETPPAELDARRHPR